MGFSGTEKENMWKWSIYMVYMDQIFKNNFKVLLIIPLTINEVAELFKFVWRNYQNISFERILFSIYQCS